MPWILEWQFHKSELPLSYFLLFFFCKKKVKRVLWWWICNAHSKMENQTVRIVMEEGFAPGLDCCDLDKEVTERKQWQQQPVNHGK